MTEFKDVKPGDRVRLTRDNGDDLTFTVEEAYKDTITGAASNDFCSWEGWKVEILEKSLPTRQLAMVAGRSTTPYILIGDNWYDVLPNAVSRPVSVQEVQNAIHNLGFEVLYEGIQEG